jgi:hypothetical protein
VPELLNRAADTREHSARMGTDQSNHPHGYRQDDSEHYGVLCDILAFFLLPRFAKKVSHSAPVWLLVLATAYSDCFPRS